jgi:hypothetical protein
MLSLQQISDRLEIQQLFTDYADAIDTRQWDRLDRVFTPDAYIDYRAMGGIDGRYPQVKAWLAQALAQFPAYYHMVGNLSVQLDGDRASSRIVCFNPMEMPIGDGKTQMVFLGLWYADRLIRTADGWRMCERVEERCFDYNVPQAMKDAVAKK